MKHPIHIVSRFKSKRLEKTETYQSKNPIIRFYSYDRLKKSLNLSEPSKNKVAIDIGCGEGYFLPTLSLNFKNAIGLDTKEPIKTERDLYYPNKNLDTSKIDEAKDLLKAENFYGKNIRLIVGDSSKLNLKNDSINVVFMIDSLEHFFHPEKALKEARRILKRDGLLIVSLPNMGSTIKFIRFITNIFINMYDEEGKKRMFYYDRRLEPKNSLQFHGHDFDWKKDGLKMIRKYFVIEKIKWSPVNQLKILNPTIIIKARKKD